MRHKLRQEVYERCRNKIRPTSTERLVKPVQELSLALTGADGATFVRLDNDQCYYPEEDAISPL